MKLACLGFTIVTLFAGTAYSAFAGERGDRANIGFEIAKQQGIILDQDNPMEGIGSYLVNEGGCNDCHTWPNYAPGGDPYQRQPKQVPLANYLAGGRLFALPNDNVCSRNISPAPGTSKPAGLTRDEFVYVLRSGCDPQSAHFHDAAKCELLAVMPWPNIQEMRTQELNAIYAYLSVLPHSEPGAAKQCVPDPQGEAFLTPPAGAIQDGKSSRTQTP